MTGHGRPSINAAAVRRETDRVAIAIEQRLSVPLACGHLPCCHLRVRPSRTLLALLAAALLTAPPLQAARINSPADGVGETPAARAVRTPPPEAAQGATVSLVATADGLLPMTYQWLKDGVVIANTTSDTLVLKNVEPKHAGKYTVTISNRLGRSTAPATVVKVTPASVKIIGQPRNMSAALGETVTFSVTTTGPTPAYQWFHGGVPVSGATGATLKLSKLRAEDAGDYQVRLTNALGSNSYPPYSRAFSATAKLTVTGFKLNGAYFGKIGTGDVAFVTGANGTADLLLNLTPTGRIVIGRNIAIAPDGTFDGDAWSFTNAATATLPTAVHLTGSIAPDGSLSGALVGDNTRFSATRSAYEADGFYSASIPGTADGAIYAIGDAGTTIVSVATVNGAVFGGSTTDGANGQVTVFAQDSAMALRVDRAQGSIGPLVQTPDSTVQWSGLRQDVASTDRFADISTRCRVRGDTDTLIAGFVIGGDSPRTVLIRAVGPTLATFGIGNPLAKPRLTLYHETAPIVVAEDWREWSQAVTDVATAIGAFPLVAGSSDAAVVATLAPGNYSAIVSGRTPESGVALVEVYDGGQTEGAVEPRLVNLSSRGQVGTADDTVVAGFVIRGNTSKRVLIRGIGPTLASFGIPNALADPVLTLRTGPTLIAKNDDWDTTTGDTTAAGLRAAAKQVGAFDVPDGSKDAALLINLRPGSYTAELAGKLGATGVALVEVYDAPAPLTNSP